jgi:hypothetical protein
MYDARLGKFLSVDPMTDEFAWWTPYQFAGNSPIWAKDLDGDEGDEPTDPNCVAPTIQTTSLSGGGSVTTAISGGGVTIDPGSPNFVTPEASSSNANSYSDPLSDLMHDLFPVDHNFKIDESNPPTQEGGNNVVFGPPTNTNQVIKTRAKFPGPQIIMNGLGEAAPFAEFELFDILEDISKGNGVINAVRDLEEKSEDLNDVAEKNHNKNKDHSTSGTGQPATNQPIKDKPTTRGGTQVKKTPVLTKPTAKTLIVSIKTTHAKTRSTNNGYIDTSSPFIEVNDMGGTTTSTTGQDSPTVARKYKIPNPNYKKQN